MHEILPGIHHWEALHPRIDMPVSSYWMEEDGVAIDPLIPEDLGLHWFATQRNRPRAVLLSNRHHFRDSARFREAFECAIYCNREGLHEFGDGDPVTGFDPGEELPGGVRVERVAGLCPDESALHLPAQRALVMADAAVRVSAQGELGFVPDSLMDDPPATKRALLAAFERLLTELDFEHLLLAHGGPLVGDGRERLQDLLDSGGRTAFEL